MWFQKTTASATCSTAPTTIRTWAHARRAGGASRHRFTRFIHDITNAQFRSKFEHDLLKLQGRMGIGVISDYEDQPLIIGSHLGTYAIVTVGRIANLAELVKQGVWPALDALLGDERRRDQPDRTGGLLINQGATFAEGIQIAQEAIEGSCSMLLLTDDGIYAARDKLGRTPVVIGQKAGAYAATMETCAFPNLGYETVRDLGPGEIVRLTPDGVEAVALPGHAMQICSFLWVYYGYPGVDLRGHQRGRRPLPLRRGAGADRTRRPWTWWPAFRIPAPATPSATPRRKACRSAGRS